MFYIKVNKWCPSRFQELGRGGEAVVYQLRNDTAAKVFLLPNAPEFAENIALKDAACVRLWEMQTKLLMFPRNLLPSFVAPTGVLMNGKEQIFGYIMPLIHGTSLDRLTRTTNNLEEKIVFSLVVKLYALISALHERGIVIGDLNENNIIVSGGTPYLIDADSVQFANYQCKTFTPRFTAPELLKVCRPQENPENGLGFVNPRFSLSLPHNKLTDWYSFLVIVMRLLTFTDPYGGIVQGMSVEERIQNGITVFDRRVVYPKVARPLSVVPRPVGRLFVRTFHLRERFVPEKAVFDEALAAARVNRRIIKTVCVSMPARTAPRFIKTVVVKSATTVPQYTIRQMVKTLTATPPVLAKKENIIRRVWQAICRGLLSIHRQAMARMIEDEQMNDIIAQDEQFTRTTYSVFGRAPKTKEKTNVPTRP